MDSTWQIACEFEFVFFLHTIMWVHSLCYLVLQLLPIPSANSWIHWKRFWVATPRVSVYFFFIWTNDRCEFDKKKEKKTTCSHHVIWIIPLIACSYFCICPAGIAPCLFAIHHSPFIICSLFFFFVLFTRTPCTRNIYYNIFNPSAQRSAAVQKRVVIWSRSLLHLWIGTHTFAYSWKLLRSFRDPLALFYLRSLIGYEENWLNSKYLCCRPLF